MNECSFLVSNKIPIKKKLIAKMSLNEVKTKNHSILKTFVEWYYKILHTTWWHYRPTKSSNWLNRPVSVLT